MKRLRKGQGSTSTNYSDSDDDGGIFASNKTNKPTPTVISSTNKPHSSNDFQKPQQSGGTPSFTTTRLISKNNAEERTFESESSSDEDDSDRERRARLRARLLSKQKEEANLNSLDTMLLGGNSADIGVSSVIVTAEKREVSKFIDANNDSEDSDLDVERIKRQKQEKTVQKRECLANPQKDQPLVTTSVIPQHKNSMSHPSQPSIPRDHTITTYENSSESSSSEEEDVRPVFISKSKRSTIKTEQEQEEEENRLLEMERKRQEQKREKNVQLLNKELENEANRKKATRIDEDISSVNDSDDIDPNSEMMAWIEREMKRLSIIKQSIEESERDFQRRVNNSSFKENKDEEPKSPYEATKPRFKTGQRYYHKGAFFMDDAEIAEKAAQVAHAPTGKDLINYDLLPKYYQTKNPGRARQPKLYKLKEQDTTDLSSPFYSADKKNHKEKKQ